ncbi:MAG: zinc ribbon domain-containing protein [Lachnospiraceae bacterium]|nr:zinc ribbon domain-containing protein [Lachnospiraceae bacterium]
MFCTNCGKEVGEGAVFCTNCGAEIQAAFGEIVPANRKMGDGKKRMRTPVIAAALAVIVALIVFLVSGLFGSGLSEDDFVVGGQIEFGHYEQDNNLSNGKEPIVWDIITRNEPGYMLVSHHILDCQPYAYTETVGSFLDTHICQWLNEEFLNEAFTSDELAYIKPMKPYGENEERHVQMLSLDQISRLYDCTSDIIPGNGETCYLSEQLICGATDYAIAQGVENYSSRQLMREVEVPAEYENRLAKWLLIYHPNSNWNTPTLVQESGLAASISLTFQTPAGIRPVIWISKEALQKL